MTSDRAVKIRNLLAKAECTDSEDEARAFFAKAQELMTLWAIDDAQIQMAKDSTLKEEIGSEIVDFPSITYYMDDVRVLDVIARQNQCRVLRVDSRNRKHCFAYLVGYESDRERVKMIFHSALIQMHRALEASLNERVDISFVGEDDDDDVFASLLQNSKPTRRQIINDMTSYRRSFRVGFANELRNRLKEARKEAAGTNLPALRDRGSEVDQYTESVFNPKTGRSRKRKLDSAGYDSGRDAAKTADLGRDKVGGSRSALKGN